MRASVLLCFCASVTRHLHNTRAEVGVIGFRMSTRQQIVRPGITWGLNLSLTMWRLSVNTESKFNQVPKFLQWSHLTISQVTVRLRRMTFLPSIPLQLQTTTTIDDPFRSEDQWVSQGLGLLQPGP